MISIVIENEKVNIDITASPSELKLLKSIVDEICNGCKEGAE